MSKLLAVVVVVMVFCFAAKGEDISEREVEMSIKVTSEAFEDGGLIPVKYTCDGEDISPALSWGPLPADTIFNRAKSGEFDVVLAMYHDQGLIPIKALAFGKGVNITIGLPFIRTSPDHGTAYDIAGRGCADGYLRSLGLV